MVTGFPDVRLTPYMGAVVLNVDLHSLAGVLDCVQVDFSSVTSSLSPLSADAATVEFDTVVLVAPADMKRVRDLWCDAKVICTNLRLVVST